MKSSAVDRVAADADAGRLADARGGELPDRLVGERARLRLTTPTRPALVDVAGHDADLALAGRDDAGAVRADQAALALPAGTRFTRTMSSTGMPSVMATIDANAGVGGLEDGVGRERRRHEDHAGVGAGRGHGLRDRVEDRDLLARGGRRIELAALARA